LCIIKPIVLLLKPIELGSKTNRGSEKEKADQIEEEKETSE